MTCPLCLKSDISSYHQDKIKKGLGRSYWQCQNCLLVFVKPQDYLSAELEKSEYDKHQNSVDDLGYRRFLEKLTIPLSKKLTSGMQGLDFACGPGPAISSILGEQGWQVDNYDPWYADNPKLLQKQYDFISCTEALEHFHSPSKELNLLTELLKPKGYLGIMTKRVTSQQAFTQWHYKNDKTHVCFFSEQSFEYIAHYWNLTLEIVNPDTVILQKRKD